MIKQDFAVTSSVSKGLDRPRQAGGKQYIWEVRHAGLLGIKYEVAVRDDLVTEDIIKREDEDGIKNWDALRGIVDAAVLG